MRQQLDALAGSVVDELPRDRAAVSQVDLIDSGPSVLRAEGFQEVLKRLEGKVGDTERSYPLFRGNVLY